MVSGMLLRLAILVDRLEARIGQRDAIVDRPVFDALEPQILDGVREHVHAVGAARIDIGEADNLVGIFGDRRGRGLVIAFDADAVAIAQGEDDRLLDVGHLGKDGIGVRLRRHLALTDAGQLAAIERQHVLVVPDIDVAVAIGAGGHDCFSFSGWRRRSCARAGT